MTDFLEIPCTDDPNNSAVFNAEADEKWLSIELELHDGNTNMTIMDFDNAAKLRDWLNDVLPRASS